MSDNQHIAFFGDGEKVFAFPTRELIEELEAKTGKGIGGLYQRFSMSDYSLSDVIEVLRLGLVGGGTTPAEADRLAKVYAIGRPLAETFAVADGVITALFFGNTDTDQPDASTDLSAAIKAAYQDVADDD